MDAALVSSHSRRVSSQMNFSSKILCSWKRHQNAAQGWQKAGSHGTDMLFTKVHIAAWEIWYLWLLMILINIAREAADDGQSKFKGRRDRS